jgi:hypothetical protein
MILGAEIYKRASSLQANETQHPEAIHNITPSNNYRRLYILLIHSISTLLIMTVVTAEHVAIAELVIYVPVALLSIFVVFRHGFYKQLGWIYLCIFSGIRIGGSTMEILSTKNPDNANDKEWATILQSVGLSPLLLSTLGLMKRM